MNLVRIYLKFQRNFVPFSSPTPEMALVGRFPANYSTHYEELATSEFRQTLITNRARRARQEIHSKLWDAAMLLGGGQWERIGGSGWRDDWCRNALAMSGSFRISGRGRPGETERCGALGEDGWAERSISA
jgi:hypothetical protein